MNNTRSLFILSVVVLAIFVFGYSLECLNSEERIRLEKRGMVILNEAHFLDIVEGSADLSRNEPRVYYLLLNDKKSASIFGAKIFRDRDTLVSNGEVFLMNNLPVEISRRIPAFTDEWGILIEQLGAITLKSR